MNRPRTLAAACALAGMLAAAPAAADPDVPPGTTYLHLVTGGHVTTPGGADLNLPPGYYLDEGSWGRLDAEVRRLQDQETRLTAENTSLRSSASSAPSWVYVAAGLAVGALAGAAYEHWR